MEFQITDLLIAQLKQQNTYMMYKWVDCIYEQILNARSLEAMKKTDSSKTQYNKHQNM